MVPRYLPEAGRENANVAFWRMLQAFSEAHESSAQEGQTEVSTRTFARRRHCAPAWVKTEHVTWSLVKTLGKSTM